MPNWDPYGANWWIELALENRLAKEGAHGLRYHSQILYIGLEIIVGRDTVTYMCRDMHTHTYILPCTPDAYATHIHLFGKK